MLNFPNAPTNGTTFGQWVYDGTKWTQGNAASLAVVNTFNSRSGAVTLSTADVTSVADATYVNVTGDTMTGNLGINATPPVAAASQLFVGSAAMIGTDATQSTNMQIASNAYIDNAAVWRMRTSGQGTVISNADGQWRWYTGQASAAAGAAITWTQALALDAAGSLTATGNIFANGIIQSNGSKIVAKGGTAVVSAVNTANNLGICLMSWNDGWNYIGRTDANGNYSGTTVMGWDGSGNAGMYQGLTVSGNLNVNGYFWDNTGRIISKGGDNPSLTVWHTAWGAACIFLDSSGQLVFGGANGNGVPLDYSRLVIDSAGNVTIKNVLALTGGYGIRYNSGSYSNGYTFLFGWSNVVNASVTCGIENGGAACTFVNACDERLKLDIAPAKFDCLGTALKLPLHEYRWLDTDDPWQLRQARKKARPRADVDKRRVGVIAQEIHKIFPEGVIAGDTFDDHIGRVWGLDQNNMIALLLGAVQQMQAEIDELKAGRH